MTRNQSQPSTEEELVDFIYAHNYTDCQKKAKQLWSHIESLRAQIASAMDILEEIPGETLEERLKNLAAMVGPLEAAYRSAKT